MPGLRHALGQRAASGPACGRGRDSAQPLAAQAGPRGGALNPARGRTQKATVAPTEGVRVNYTTEDFRQLLSALVAYAESDLDQWAMWRLPTTPGEVFVTLSREALAAGSADAYDRVQPDMPLRDA